MIAQQQLFKFLSQVHVHHLLRCDLGEEEPQRFGHRQRNSGDFRAKGLELKGTRRRSREGGRGETLVVVLG